MKKNVWIVIAVVLFFLGLIISFALTPADRNVAGQGASAAAEVH